MANVTLKIFLGENKENYTNLRTTNTTQVYDVIKKVVKKTAWGGQDHGIFKFYKDKPGGIWLKPNNALVYYEIITGDELYYLKKHQILKIKLMDNSLKTNLQDISLSVQEIVDNVCSKLGIPNSPEYSLGYMVQDKFKWLNPKIGLREQSITSDDCVILRKKYFLTDDDIDKYDPGQLHLVYEQCKQSILSELYPCSEEQATTFAGIQAVVEQGEYSENKRKHIKVNLLLPKMHNNKKTTTNLFDIWKQKGKMDVLQAKKEYIAVCRKLTTYGVTLFEVKEMPSGKDKKRKSIKYKEMVIGITRDAVIRIDPKNKEILTSYPLKYLKRWGCTSETKVFSFDFGTHLEDYYEVMSEDMEDISSLLSGYVEVLVKNKKGEISLTKNKKVDEKHEDWQAPDISDHLIDKIMVLSLGGYLKGIFSGPNISFMNVTDVPTSIIALDSLYKEVSLPKITKGLQTNPSVTTIIQLLTEANKNLLGFMDLLYKEIKEGKNIGKVVSFCQSITENFSDIVNASRVYFAVQNDKNYQDAVVRLFDPLRAFVKRVEELTKPRRQDEQLTDTTFDSQLLSNFKTASSYLVGTIENSLIDISSEDLIIEYLEKVYTESKKQESDQKFREEVSILICTLGSEENKKKALQVVTKFKDSYPNIVNYVKQLESSIECATLKSVIDIDTYFGELKLIQNACEEIIYSVGSKQKLKNAQKRIIDISSNVLSVALQASSVEGDIDLINDTKYILLKIEKIKNQCFPVIDNPKNMTGYRKLLRTTQKLIGFIEDLLQGKTHSIEMSLIRQLSKALLASITVLATKVTIIGKNSEPELSKQLEVFGQEFMELVRVAYLEQNEKSKQDLFVKKAKQSLGSLEKLVTQVTKVFLPKINDTSGKTVINTSVQRLKTAVISLQRWLYEKQDEDDINILGLLNQIELINAYINSSILNNLVGDIEEQTMSREEAAKKLRETIEIFRKLCHKLPSFNEIKEVIDNSKLTVEQLNNIFIFSKKLSLVTCGGREEQEKPLLMSKQLTKPTNELIKHCYNAILKTNETENLREKVIPEILDKIDKILDGQLLLCQPQDSLPGNEHLSIIEKITKLLNSENNSGVSNNETVRLNANKLLKSTLDVVNSAKNGQKDLVDLLQIVSEDTEQFYNSIHGLKSILNKGQFEQAEQKGKNICNIVKDTLSHTKYAYSDLRERNLLDSFSSKLGPAVEDLFEFLRESTPGISEAKNAQKQISSMIEKINNVDGLFEEREKHRNKYNILLLIKLANIAKEATSNSSNIRSKEVHKLGESLEVCAHKIVEFADAVIYLNDLSFLSFIINIVDETIALLTKSTSVEEQVLFGNKLLLLLPKLKDLISVVDEKDEKKKEKLNKTVYVIREMSDKIIHTLNEKGIGKVISLVDFLKESINRFKQLSPSLQNTLKMTTFLQDVLSSAQSMTQNGIRVVLDPSNSFLGAQFTISCKNTEVEIDKVVESALNLSIGREQVLKLSKVIDNSIIDLDTSNVFSQMGLVEKSKNTNHSSLQESLSLTASSINEHFDKMLLHTKNTDLISFSQLCSPLSDSVTNFVQTSKNISSLSSDEKVQQQQLEKTASILKEMKHFVSECLTFTENPEDKSQVEKIEKFINSSKQAFSELLQEKNKEEEIKNLCEKSINKINSVSDLKEGSKKSFLESKENLIEGAKKVALSSQKLLNSAKNEFGDHSVSFSDSVESMSLLVSDSISSIEQSEIKENIKEVWKSFCKVSTTFIAKGNEIKDPKLRKTEMTKIFRELRDNLGKLVNYVFEAALGEKKCLESAEKLRKIQSSIEASLLLSEIGLTSQQNQSKNISFSESLGQIKNKSVSLSSTLLTSQSQTSLGETVDSFTQQMEDAYQLVLSSTLEIDENKSKTDLLQSFKYITINAQKLVLYAKQDKKDQNQVESLTTEFSQSFNSTFQIVSKVFSEREQVQKYVSDVIEKIEKSLQSPTSNTTDLKKVGEICKELTTNSLNLTSIWRDEPLKIQKLLSNFSDHCSIVLGFSTSNENLKGSSKAFCQSIVELLKLIRERPKVDDYDAIEAISSAGDNVGIKMTELFRSFNELNTESVKVEEDDLADEVVKKLEDLFSAISNNKNSFTNLKSNVEVMKVIGKASTAILQTTETLISASINTQKELREKGRNLPKTNVYRKDPQWARGLIKTCEEVEHSSKQFCHDLFKLDLNFDVQPNELIERLIESVNLLADDSQRLVAASRAKIDLSSPSSKKLSEAGKLVANATNTLLNAVKNWAKNYKEESTKLKPFAERLREDPELMTQMEIAKLEKDIDLEKIILRIKKERVDQLNDN